LAADDRVTCFAGLQYRLNSSTLENDLLKLIINNTTRNDANMSKAKAQFYKIVKPGRKLTYNTRFRPIESSLAEKYPNSFHLNAEN
jgi:hypothetical protein